MKFWEDERTVLYQGDALSVLRTLEAGSVQTVVTSPPYWGLRDYGVADQIGLEPTPEEYVAAVVAVFREVRRVLRDDGTVWLNLGDSYAGSGKGQGGVLNSPKQRSNAGSYHEAFNWVTPDGLKPKDLVGIPWMVAFALRADGWWLRSDIVWSKPNPMPESVQDRPTRSHEYVFLLSKASRYFYDAAAIREAAPERSVKMPDGWDTGDGAHGTIHRNGREKGQPNNALVSGRNKRSVWEIPTQPYPEAHFATFPEELVKPCILAGTSERGQCGECGAPWERLTNTTRAKDPTRHTGRAANGCNDRQDGDWPRMLAETVTVGWRPTCSHSGEPVPQSVLDPFAGSGTTGVVARKAGRKAVLIELNADYCQLAANRFRQAVLL